MQSTEVLYPYTFSFVWKCRFHKLCLFINPLELKEDSRHYCKIMCLSLWVSPTPKLPFCTENCLLGKTPYLSITSPLCTHVIRNSLYIIFSSFLVYREKVYENFLIHFIFITKKIIDLFKKSSYTICCCCVPFYLLGVTFKTSPRLKIEKLIKNQTVFLSVHRNEITNSWTLKQLDVKLATSS